MKKFLALSALIASIGFGALSAEAKSTESTGSLAINAAATAATTQIRVQLGNRNRYRRVRVVTQTRIVRVGRQRYRETYQTTYRPNGRVTTRIISRVRVR